jgi:purine nucleosidase
MASANPNAKRPILFDTDIGSDVDDALALGLILARPAAFELVAVTTVAKDPELAAEIAASLLGAGGRTDVQVSPGEAHPLLRPHAFNAFGHEAQCVLTGARAEVVGERAPERIVRAAREVEGLEIILVGPLTNLARALALDPELPRRVAGITVMGGHVREVKIGNFRCPYGIDYNLCSDPEASVSVLGAGFRTTLISADVTLQTWLRRGELDAIAATGPLGAALVHQTGLWTPVQRQIFTGIGGSVAEDNVAFLHDPLAVWSLVDASALHFEELQIVPTIENGVLRTREAPLETGFGAAMRVATAVDADRASRAIAGALAEL